MTSGVQESEGEEAAESRVALDTPGSTSAATRQCRIRLHEVCHFTIVQKSEGHHQHLQWRGSQWRGMLSRLHEARTAIRLPSRLLTKDAARRCGVAAGSKKTLVQPRTALLACSPCCLHRGLSPGISNQDRAAWKPVRRLAPAMQYC